MKRPINVQPEVKACYLEIQMEGGREGGSWGREEKSRRKRGREFPSFLPSKTGHIKENNNRPLSDISGRRPASVRACISIYISIYSLPPPSFSPHPSSPLAYLLPSRPWSFQAADSNKMLKVMAVISHVPHLMWYDHCRERKLSAVRCC